MRKFYSRDCKNSVLNSADWGGREWRTVRLAGPRVTRRGGPVTRGQILTGTAVAIVLPAVLIGAGFFYMKAVHRPPGVCIQGDCENGVGTLQLERPQPATLQGTFKNGELEGRGLFITRAGDRYEGDWRAGQKHGFGRYQYPSGAVYEGQFVENEKQGYGRFVWPDGIEYRGQWYAGEPHGAGSVALPGGATFEGRYDSGEVVAGNGIKVFPDGSRYFGQFRGGRREGLGLLLDAQGAEIYRGRWRADRPAPEP